MATTTQPSSSSPFYTKKEAKMHDFVEILITDPVLLNKWSQFCEKLDCPVQDKLRWDRGIGNGTFQYYKVFSEMLNSWVERNPNKITVRDLCRLLKGIECSSVAEKLEENFNKDEIIQQGGNCRAEISEFVKSGKEISWPITHGLFVPTANFTGREEELKEIHDNFKTTNLVLITGFGGIGKTEFCRKFAYEISYSNVSRVWLRSENLETLRDSVLKLAGELGVKNEGNPPISEYFEYLTSFILENCTRLLVIIDNVDVIYEEALKVIKIIKMAKSEEKMSVIVTSRDSNVLEGAGITMKLNVLSELQARKMLQKSMSDLTDSDADKLGGLVEYFPLALQQAVAYIKQQRNHFRTTNYSVSDYVEDFEVKKREMLGQRLNKFEHDYSLTTLITWDMTISKMTDSAVEILKIIAYLDADGVKLNFFEKVCRHMGVVDFDDGLDMLDKYCLVKIDEVSVHRLVEIYIVVSVHRLVQEVMRGKVDDVEYSRKLFDCVLLVSSDILQIYPRYYRVHLNSVCKFVWKCEMQIREFSDALLFLLERDRIDCAEKVTKLKYPNIEFSSELGVEKREFLDKVFLWSLLCRDSETTSEEFTRCNLLTEEITKGDFNVDRNYDKYLYYVIPLKSIEAQVQMSVKYFGERSKITFAVKNLLVRKLFLDREFDKGLELLEKELVTFPFEADDIGMTEFLFQSIQELLWDLDDALESYTPSLLASLEKIINHLGETYPNNSVEWMKLEALWCDLKGDYEKALELLMKVDDVDDKRINSKYWKYHRVWKIIELRIKLTNFDVTTVGQFVRDLGGEVCKFHMFNFTLRGLGEILAIYEANLGEGHELTIDIKLGIARKLEIENQEERSIQLCEQVLRSQVDGKYKKAFKYLCEARNIEENYDEQKKILQNLLESKILELGKNHRNTKVVLGLLQELSLKCIKNSNDEKRLNNSIKQKASNNMKKLRCSFF